ncbi:hypothetical protein [Micromonospora globbae]|jgi:hypothetical protein|uniref:hypothetical protein n=1 Tax=Micromonospora globbae TaxID=1894969 RepID=UPI003419DF6F
MFATPPLLDGPSRSGLAPVVTLFGELDIAAASPLGEVLPAAIARAPRVQVDPAG